MVQESVYCSPDGTAVPIQWNIENVIKFTLGGEMHATTSHVNYCSGTRIKVKTGFIDEGLELNQIKVLIRKTWILAKPNHGLIADQTMVYLP